MRPTLVAGDQLLCRRLTADDALTRGDLVGFFRGERLVVHRVVVVERSQVLTMADAAVFPDLPLSRDEVFCLVARAWRGRRALDLALPPSTTRATMATALLARRWLRLLAPPAVRRLWRWLRPARQLGVVGASASRCASGASAP